MNKFQKPPSPLRVAFSRPRVRKKHERIGPPEELHCKMEPNIFTSLFFAGVPVLWFLCGVLSWREVRKAAVERIVHDEADTRYGKGERRAS